MISATTWVPRGYASQFPEKYVLDDDEMERINQLAQLNLEDAKAELAASGVEEEEEEANAAHLKDQLDVDDDLKEFDLEHYDDETNANGLDVSMFPGLAGEDVQFHEAEDGEDPYISLPTQEDTNEEKEELQVYPTDNMILATRTEDEVSYLDIYVYDDGAGFHDREIPVEKGDEQDPDVARGLIRDSSLYVHHDLMLPAFPLCVEWLNYKPGSQTEDRANFAAIGTFDPNIEIWNLDCIDKAFPDLILGEPLENSVNDVTKSQNKKKKKKKHSQNVHIATHHTDAILSLSHNKHYLSMLASTSADHTVKIWDLNTGVAVRSLASIHDYKNVSSSEWHWANGSLLLTGGYDSRIALTDLRISEDSDASKYWSTMTGEEIECATFADENIIICGTDSGNIYSFDIRKSDNTKPIWTLKAHDAGISTLSANRFVPGMMVTGAMGEKIVKLWKFSASENSVKGPSMVLSRDFDVGNVLSASFAPDIEVAGNMVIGGVSKGLKLWDVFTNRSVRKNFAPELSSLQNRAKLEAQQQGRSSRISRKYIKNDNPDTVITIDDKGEEEEEEEEE